MVHNRQKLPTKRFCRKTIIAKDAKRVAVSLGNELLRSQPRTVWGPCRLSEWSSQGRTWIGSWLCICTEMKTAINNPIKPTSILAWRSRLFLENQTQAKAKKIGPPRSKGLRTKALTTENAVLLVLNALMFSRSVVSRFIDRFYTDRAIRLAHGGEEGIDVLTRLPVAMVDA